jgi:hypothetical protein
MNPLPFLILLLAGAPGTREKSATASEAAAVRTSAERLEALIARF